MTQLNSVFAIVAEADITADHRSGADHSLPVINAFGIDFETGITDWQSQETEIPLGKRIGSFEIVEGIPYPRIKLYHHSSAGLTPVTDPYEDSLLIVTGFVNALQGGMALVVGEGLFCSAVNGGQVGQLINLMTGGGA